MPLEKSFTDEFAVFQQEIVDVINKNPLKDSIFYCDEFPTLKIDSMKGTCKHCGCTETNACYHPDFGTCWWMDDNKDECSHCIELKNFPGVIKPKSTGMSYFLASQTLPKQNLNKPLS